MIIMKKQKERVKRWREKNEEEEMSMRNENLKNG